MTTQKKTTNIPADKLALYEKLIAATPGVEIKANFGFPYTAINGNMYSLISTTGSVGLRLSKTDRQAFLEKYQTTLYEHIPGALLKEYVTVPDYLLQDTEALIFGTELPVCSNPKTQAYEEKVIVLTTGASAKR